MKYLQNLHTHSTFCDGKDTPEEMVLAAIEKDFDSIGFSGHSSAFYSPYINVLPDNPVEYRSEIKNLKEKYKDKIDIYCGIEVDMYSATDLSDFDYIIGSIHYLKMNGEYIGFDRGHDEVKNVIDTYFGGDGMKFVKEVYRELALLPEVVKAKVDIVGHFDLVAKHLTATDLFDAESKEYKILALEALHALAEKIDLFEINTGAIARGYRNAPYPAPFLLKELSALKKGIVISSDCHDSRFLDCSFNEAELLAKECGFKEHYVLKDSGFHAVSF